MHLVDALFALAVLAAQDPCPDPPNRAAEAAQVFDARSEDNHLAIAFRNVRDQCFDANGARHPKTPGCVEANAECKRVLGSRHGDVLHEKPHHRLQQDMTDPWLGQNYVPNNADTVVAYSEWQMSFTCLNDVTTRDNFDKDQADLEGRWNKHAAVSTEHGFWEVWARTKSLECRDHQRQAEIEKKRQEDEKKAQEARERAEQKKREEDAARQKRVEQGHKAQQDLVSRFEADQRRINEQGQRTADAFKPLQQWAADKAAEDQREMDREERKYQRDQERRRREREEEERQRAERERRDKARADWWAGQQSKPKGTLLVNAEPNDAELFVTALGPDGGDIGSWGPWDPKRPSDLQPARWRVELRKPGHDAAQTTVDVPEGGTVTVSLRLNLSEPRLVLNGQGPFQWNSDVVDLDGCQSRREDFDGKTFVFPAGHHRIEVRNPAAEAPFRTEFDAVAGQVATVEAKGLYSVERLIEDHRTPSTSGNGSFGFSMGEAVAPEPHHGSTSFGRGLVLQVETRDVGRGDGFFARGFFGPSPEASVGFLATPAAFPTYAVDWRLRLGMDLVGLEWERSGLDMVHALDPVMQLDARVRLSDGVSAGGALRAGVAWLPLLTDGVNTWTLGLQGTLYFGDFKLTPQPFDSEEWKRTAAPKFALEFSAGPAYSGFLSGRVAGADISDVFPSAVGTSVRLGFRAGPVVPEVQWERIAHDVGEASPYAHVATSSGYGDTILAGARFYPLQWLFLQAAAGRSQLHQEATDATEQSVAVTFSSLAARGGLGFSVRASRYVALEPSLAVTAAQLGDYVTELNGTETAGTLAGSSWRLSWTAAVAVAADLPFGGE